MKDDMKIEMEAGRKIQLDHLNEFITNPQDCESIYIEALKRGNKDLVEKNARLQAELDKAIHKLSDYEKALKIYAESDNWDLKTLQIEKVKYGWKPALETLKKWEDK